MQHVIPQPYSGPIFKDGKFTSEPLSLREYLAYNVWTQEFWRGGGEANKANQEMWDKLMELFGKLSPGDPVELSPHEWSVLYQQMGLPGAQPAYWATPMISYFLKWVRGFKRTEDLKKEGT